MEKGIEWSRLPKHKPAGQFGENPLQRQSPFLGEPSGYGHRHQKLRHTLRNNLFEQEVLRKTELVHLLQTV